MAHGTEPDLSDFSMLDLFRSEVEVHAATLNDSLLALEREAGSLENVESLMRAAHSIKGGARIVELDVVVKLAHAMEDCFVAVQKGELFLGSEEIDVLLKTVDMICRISENAGDSLSAWLTKHQSEVDYLIATVPAIMAGEPPPPPPSKTEPEITPDADSAAETTEIAGEPDAESEPDAETDHSTETGSASPSTGSSPALTESEPSFRRESVERRPQRQRTTPEKDRTVRVTAGKIDRLMGLAGEVVVGSRWLAPFQNNLTSLKSNHAELYSELDLLLRTHDLEEDKNKLRELIVRAREKAKDCNQRLMDRLTEIDRFTSTTASLSDRLYHEVVSVRMSPFADGVRGFPRMVRDIARELGKKVRLEINGETTEVDRDILEKLDAPLSHLIRNALDHGIEPPEKRRAAGKPETGLLTLEAVHRSGILMITLTDDGRGIDLAELRKRILERGLASAEMVERMTDAELLEFLFLSGFSTVDEVTELSGRGVGLDVVHNMVHAVGGVVRAFTKSGVGTSFQLELPLTLSVISALLVEIDEEPYAFPLARIDRCRMLDPDDIDTVEDRQYFRLDNRNISLVDIRNVLNMAVDETDRDQLTVVVLSDRIHAYGLVVDRILGETELVVRPLDPRLGKIPDIAAAAVMLDGTPVLIFDLDDLVRSIDGILNGKTRMHKVGRSKESLEAKRGKRILVVDDSITVREMERKILENKGYQVEVAVDGMDGWNMLRTGSFDMIVSDVDMPRMNGFELITQIKGHERFKSLPVMIVSYKNKEEDRLRGLEVGANYYLTKSSFQDNSFIEAVADLIGEP